MFTAIALLNLSLPFAAHLISDHALKYWIVFGILFVYGPLNGIVAGTTFGLAGPLPSAYVGAIMFGNGLSGIGSTLIGLILVALLPG